MRDSCGEASVASAIETTSGGPQTYILVGVAGKQASRLRLKPHQPTCKPFPV